MNKTIKQIADELGISKQAVRKHLNKLSTTTVSTSANRTTLINDEGQRLIKSWVSTQSVTKPTTSVNQLPPNNEVIELLKKQLLDKDIQIEKLTADKDLMIATLTKALDQSQQLQLITMQEKQLLIEDKNQSIFNRIFKKGKG